MTLIDQIFEKTQFDQNGKLIERPWMDSAVELDLIRTYQQTRSTAAAEQLIVQYSLAIRNAIFAVQTHQKVSNQNVETAEDLAGFAVAGFLEVVTKFDTQRFLGLGQVIVQEMQEVIRDEKQAHLVLSVAPAAYHRWVKIIAETTQPQQAAVKGKRPPKLVPLAVSLKKHKMSAENFAAVTEAVNNRVPMADVDESTVSGMDDMKKVDDMLLLSAALAALTEEEMDVVLLAYGFDGEPLTVRDIALQLHMSKSRADRLRASALLKMRNTMRDTLGVTDKEVAAPAVTQAALAAAA